MNTERLYGPRLKIKVVNTSSGRVDYHEGITKEEIDWIKSNPRLHVEVFEDKNGKRRNNR